MATRKQQRGKEHAAGSASPDAVSVLAKSREMRIAVQDIEPRFHEATRLLDPSHVVALAESISALGLIEPLAVDRKFRLLAGGHRWVALRLLAERPEARAELGRRILTSEAGASELMERLEGLPAFENQVPVHVLEFDSSEAQATALAVEIAKNEKRRNYTPVEVKRLAETMRKAGFRDAEGRPKKGERPLAPALAVVLGKSERTVRRLLAVSLETRTNDLVSGTTSATLEDRRLLKALCRWKDRLGLHRSDEQGRKAFDLALELIACLEKA
jgi:ParB family chromosome partitioning protein